MKKKRNHILSRVISIFIICVLLLTGMSPYCFAAENAPATSEIQETAEETTEVSSQSSAEEAPEGEAQEGEEAAGTETSGTENAAPAAVGAEAGALEADDASSQEDAAVALLSAEDEADEAELAEDPSPYPTNLVNGSFETKAYYTDTSNTRMYYYAPAETIDGWYTTATDKQIEVAWLSNRDKTGGTSKHMATNVYIKDGYQFAELNAAQESTLYQYIQTEPGARYDWSLYHRGRTGVDTMALVIGPKQDYDPKKTSKTARDQLMQIVDWLKTQTDVVIEEDGDNNCSQKLTVYTSKFNSNGGFATASPFSWTEDAEHTEEWNVWIISSTNDDWYGYGKADDDANYDYSYYVPDGGGVALFSFVSYKSAPKTDGTVDMTFGNMLDTVEFDINYHILATSTPNGSGSYFHADEIGEIDEAEEIAFSSDNPYSGWALANTALRVVAKPREDRAFLGAVINGEFITKDSWTPDPDTGEYYYEVDKINQHYDIRLIFAAEHVLYDVNGGDAYHYNPDDPDTGCEVLLSEEASSYTSHAAESSKDGWRFTGWQYTHADSTSYLFDGVHTVSYQANASDAAGTIQIVDSDSDPQVSGISASEGVTLVAQWLYRQRYAAQILDDTGAYVFSTDGGSISTNMELMTDTEREDFLLNGAVVPGGGEYYLPDDGRTVTLTATPSTGYRFAGWYDPAGKLVSNSRNYTYLVHDRLVNTLYARFDPEGHDLSVSKVIPTEYGTFTCYFRVDITLTGLRPDTAYKITNGTLTNMTTADGLTISSNPTYVKADADGTADVTIYLKAGETTVISDLPSGTGYKVIEQDYTAYSYNSSGNVTTPATMTDDQTVTITNIVQEYVVDFGLPMTFEVPQSVLGDGVTIDAGNAVYGDVTIADGNKVTYTPTETLKGIDQVNLTLSNGGSYDVNIYPATTVYYEADFATNLSGFSVTGANPASQTASAVGTKANYGYDAAYAGAQTSGTVAASSDKGSTAEFTFTGTGVEIYTNNTPSSGRLFISVAKNGTVEKSVIVDTKMKNGDTDATKDQNVEALNVPVATILGLSHGEHTVTIRHLASPETDDNGKNTYVTYPVAIDGFRVFGTLSDQGINEYKSDLEEKPTFVEMRSAVLKAVGITAGTDLNAQVDAAISGQDASALVVTSATNVTAGDNAQDLLNNGPKNEIYLRNGESLVFKLTTKKTVQLGMRALGAGTSYKINTGANTSISSNTDMFYNLQSASTGAAKTYTIANTGEGILAITLLKVSDDPEFAMDTLTEEDLMQALIDLGLVSEPDSEPEPEPEPETENPFEDVPNSAWFYKNVMWGYQNGVIAGTDKTHFSPNASCTRAQAITFIWRAAGRPQAAAGTVNPFKDVSANAYYDQAVLWAVEQGIVKGVSSDQFAPNETCTRAQIMAFINRWAGRATAGEGTENPFKDVADSQYYYKAVLWGVEQGIVKGVSAEEFAPNAVCTRAQIIAFIARYAGR